jgi:hypothetical protein
VVRLGGRRFSAALPCARRLPGESIGPRAGPAGLGLLAVRAHPRNFVLRPFRTCLRPISDRTRKDSVTAAALIELEPTDTFGWFEPLREEVA